ncbi:acyl carrier protein [Sphingomonas piscis]|uniref:Acyl carrier protein n=1 Tax=Sphingomonas piscis TaxID=2714943 RepID=A0A6G7YNL8_9SPHN|nr:acyl carrier protein [Sphingomonas piscis]QIK78331.1 acyl carrier protein [Sphingomonas piscis]
MDEQRARIVIADHLALPVASISDDADFLALGADSLDMVSLTMRLEEEFNTHIPDDGVEDCRTVGQAIAMLRTSLAAPA